MDVREPLAQGASLTLGGRTYFIRSLIGYGGTSFVYSAWYADSLRLDKSHSVLIKELFPYHPKSLITRGVSGEIVVMPGAEEYYALRKKSFIRGNNAHIDLQNTRADMANVNIDSYEERGSVYTILGNLNGETLQSVLRGGELKISLSVALSWTQSLLDALEVFHRNRFLHLDISTDNVLLLPLDDDKPEKQRRVLLIDYNSVWDMDELLTSEDLYFSIKNHYSAIEVRLREQRSLSEASDLFSVCAVFLELLQGKPLDFSILYTGGPIIEPDARLLKNAAPQVKEKIVEILRQGLKLPPKRRYQTIPELRRELNELENLVFGEDLLKRAVRFFKKHTVKVILITLVAAFALSFAAIGIHEGMRGYPRSVQEKYVTNNAMTALASSLAKLGAQLENDRSALQALDSGYERFISVVQERESENDAHTLGDRYDETSLDAFRAGPSPIAFDLLLELFNAPNDYRTWSDGMLAGLQSIFTDERYPEEDRKKILSLYSDYLNAYTEVCYAKVQLVVLPLNDDGRKELFHALPYVPVFGERFVSRPFGNSHTELESALTAAQSKLKALSAELKSYGVEATWLN